MRFVLRRKKWYANHFCNQDMGFPTIYNFVLCLPYFKPEIYLLRKFTFSIVGCTSPKSVVKECLVSGECRYSRKTTYLPVSFNVIYNVPSIESNIIWVFFWCKKYISFTPVTWYAYINIKLFLDWDFSSSRIRVRLCSYWVCVTFNLWYYSIIW
jgi:hypothetical protein